MKNLFYSLVFFAVLIAGGIALFKYSQSGGKEVGFRTGKVERGDLVVTVSATGTLEPEEMIDVGAQVVGRIKEFGADPRSGADPAIKNKRIDYTSTVDEGTVLALIDDSVYVAQRDQAEASLQRAKADLMQLDAHLAQAEAEWKRAQRLQSLSVETMSPTESKDGERTRVPIRGISDSDFILAKANYEVAKANIDVGEAVVAQQQSALELAKTNLSYTVIKSPIKGTIIDRRVNIGQTVVSSLNAPSLFLIAQDLRRMQVWASVNEADIGELKLGTPVTFTVDAFPKDKFHGEVVQVRLNAKITQNVVTFTVAVATDNSSLKLLPFLTADVKFETARREGVLSVPNAALRFEPRPDLVAAPPDVESGAAMPEASGDEGTVWVQSGEHVYPVRVTVGVTDGTRTEVAGEQLTEGQEIVLNELQKGEAPSQVNNPFAPKMPRGGGRR